jgi:hypothetical protein
MQEIGRRVACLWRIDTVGVKRSDPRSPQQPRTQAPDDLIGSLPKVDRIPERSRVFGITQSLVSDIRIDSEVAIETSGDLRLLETQADSAFALPCNPKPKSLREAERNPFNLGHNDLANYSCFAFAIGI